MPCKKYATHPKEGGWREDTQLCWKSTVFETILSHQHSNCKPAEFYSEHGLCYVSSSTWTECCSICCWFMSKRIFCASCLQISNLIPGTVLQFTKHWCINSSLLKLLSALLIYGFFPSFALPVFNSSQSKLKKIAAPLVLGDQLSDNRASRVLLGSNLRLNLVQN